MVKTIIYSLVAGVIGTVIGGLISVFLGRRGDKFISYLLAFAGGFMLAIVCFDLIPESMEKSNIWIVLSSIAVGLILVILFEYLIDYSTSKFSRLRHMEDNSKNKSMFRVGIIMTIAIAMHNLPEGLAIGASIAIDNGIIISILICLHNIPEGMAMATPMITSGTKWWKILLYTALTGFPTVIGAIIGYLISDISIVFVSACLAIAAGFMLYIVFCEMLPTAMAMQNNKKLSSIIVIISFMLGAMLIYLI